MKKLMIAMLALAACSKPAANAQTVKPSADSAKVEHVERPILETAAETPFDGEPKRLIERPIKRAAASPAIKKYDLSRTGIEWHKGIDAVLGKDKPILLLQILGNYDEVYC